jgi:hypothetical protein
MELPIIPVTNEVTVNSNFIRIIFEYIDATPTQILCRSISESYNTSEQHLGENLVELIEFIGYNLRNDSKIFNKIIENDDNETFKLLLGLLPL